MVKLIHLLDTDFWQTENRWNHFTKDLYVCVCVCRLIDCTVYTVKVNYSMVVWYNVAVSCVHSVVTRAFFVLSSNRCTLYSYCVSSRVLTVLYNFFFLPLINFHNFHNFFLCVCVFCSFLDRKKVWNIMPSIALVCVRNWYVSRANCVFRQHCMPWQ